MRAGSSPVLSWCLSSLVSRPRDHLWFIVNTKRYDFFLILHSLYMFFLCPHGSCFPRLVLTSFCGWIHYSVLCRIASWDGSEDAFSSFIGYYELTEETGAKFAPQNNWIRCCVELHHGTVPRTLSLLLLVITSLRRKLGQNSSRKTVKTVQFDTIPTQPFSSSQNADTILTLEGVWYRDDFQHCNVFYVDSYVFFFTALKMVWFVFQPLMECYVNLREKGTAINIHLTETWWRHYQVRTTSLKEGKELANFVRHNKFLLYRGSFPYIFPLLGRRWRRYVELVPYTGFPLYQ